MVANFEELECISSARRLPCTVRTQILAYKQDTLPSYVDFLNSDNFLKHSWTNVPFLSLPIKYNTNQLVMQTTCKPLSSAEI